jgi:hypothetical protein
MDDSDHYRCCVWALQSVFCSTASAENLIPANVPLTPIMQFPGTTGYIAPDYDAQRAKLHSVYIAPIEIFLAPDSHTGVSSQNKWPR